MCACGRWDEAGARAAAGRRTPITVAWCARVCVCVPVRQRGRATATRKRRTRVPGRDIAMKFLFVIPRTFTSRIHVSTAGFRDPCGAIARRFRVRARGRTRSARGANATRLAPADQFNRGNTSTPRQPNASQLPAGYQSSHHPKSSSSTCDLVRHPGEVAIRPAAPPIASRRARS